MDQNICFDDLEDISAEIIENQPWALELWEYLSNGFHKSFLHWCKYVLVLSEEPRFIQNWVEIFKQEFEKDVCELVTDMRCLNYKIISRAEDLMAQLQELCRDLRMEMPVLGVKKNLGLFDEINRLEDKIREFKDLMNKRLEEVEILLERQTVVCRSLNRTPRYLAKKPLPTQKEILSLQTFVESLEHEKFEREEFFMESKMKIMELVRELDYQPLSEFECEVLSNEDGRFLVTDQNMQKLDEFKKSLIQRRQEMSQEICDKWAKVERLWSVLEIDLTERARFNDNRYGKTSEVLKKLNEELKRLELIKKENIKVFIEKYRNQLQELWDLCHVSPEHRDFIYFHSDCYTEDFLDLFELEIGKWKNYYEQNKHLLKLIEEYHACWTKVAEIDEKARGPNRYKNRGGQLLLEERERNKLNKKIPLIETELKTLSNQFTETTGLTFYTWGKTIDDLIEGLYSEREAERKQKLSAHKLQRERTMLTPGKSCTQLFTTSSKQTPNAKRKMGTTPISQLKKAKINTKLARSETKRRISGIKNVRRSTELIRKKRRSSGRKSNNKENVTDTDYDEFQTELANKSNSHRSTLHNEELLPSTSSKPQTHKALKTRVGALSVPLISVTAPTPMKSSKHLGTPKNTRLAIPQRTPSTPKSPRRFQKVFSTHGTNLKLNF